MKRLLTTLLTTGFILCSGTAFAESSLGFAAGSTRGAGVTYRTIPGADSDSRLGWQVTGIPVVTPEYGFLSLGLAAIYVLDHGRHGLLYASFGMAGVKQWDSCGDGWEGCEEEAHWGIGAGPGIGFELRFWSNFGLALDVPLAFLYGDEGFVGIYPVPNTSIVYNW
ncbi:MAG TPA: hypothetical protein EYN08_00530 [Gammaproteobacteria bacterium]|nr:hypothetical protein [Gammaproteobacteria bacterium]